MRKTVSVALLFIFLFSAISPSFAQKTTARLTDQAKSRTQFGEVKALTEGTGVLIRWVMDTEVATAGYNVYRIGTSGTELVNETTRVGSWARHRDRVALGEMYQIFDPNGEFGSTYFIVGRDIKGGSFSSKPVSAVITKDLETVTGISSEKFMSAALGQNHNIEQRTAALPSELRDLVSASQLAPDPENQWWVASQHGAKIAVKKDGFYRIPAAQLQAANFPVNENPANWRLFLDGVEQAIIVPPGGEYIEFYGKGIDIAQTDTRIYYLLTGSVPGKRIGTRIARPISGFAVSKSYPVTAQKKERTGYAYSTLFNGDGDNFLGRLIQFPVEGFPPPPPIPFTITGIDTSVPNAQVTINLRGFTNNAHNVRVLVNGNELPAISDFGDGAYSATRTIPTSQLTEGVNALDLIPSGPADSNVFDSVTVNYLRKYQADDNKISFFTPGYRKVDVTGFTTPNVRIFDLTIDGSPSLVSNIPIVEEGGTYTAKIPTSRPMVAYGLEDSGLLQSSAVTENKASTLSLTTNGADMLIISFSASTFMSASENWAAYRRSPAGGSFTVKVIDVADIYDEFNFGTFGSAGIKSFLEHAHTEWQTAPKYVMLVGDGSNDPRNYLGTSFSDLIPTKSVTLILGESISDEALGDFDDDGLAEMAIGRIPARQVSTITTVYNKTVLFETPEQQSLNRGALFAHDLPNGYDFAGMNLDMSNQLPRSVPISMVDRASPTAQSELISQMNSGKFIINYSGHGSTGLWASSAFFSSTVVPQLTNVGSPSIYSMLTCLNGYFALPEGDSLSEVLLKHTNGGAVATWSSASLTTPDIQQTMGTRFFNQLAAGEITRIGDLIRDAKTSIPFGADVRLSWGLLGDPALKVR